MRAAILTMMTTGALAFGAGTLVATKSAARPTASIQALASVERIRPVCPSDTTSSTRAVFGALFGSRKEAMDAFVQDGGDLGYVFVPASRPLTACRTYPADEEGRLYLGPKGEMLCLPYYPRPEYP